MALHHNEYFEEAYINLSTAYLNKKSFKLSLKTLKTLESINPKHPLLHYNFSCYYALLGNIPKGIESLSQAIANGFKNHQILNFVLSNIGFDYKIKSYGGFKLHEKRFFWKAIK